MNPNAPQILLKIRLLVLFFIAALVVSGLTAFPLVAEMKVLSSILGIDAGPPPTAYMGLKQLIDIADTGNIMPPKTTWFEPKLRSGLVIHSLE